MSWNGPTDPYGRSSGPQLGQLGSKGPRQQAHLNADPLQQCERQLQSNASIAQVGRPDYSDYNFKTDLANQRVDANNASMDAMNQHLATGGGLQANNTDLSNLYGPVQREVNARDAANLNSDATGEGRSACVQPTTGHAVR